MITATGLQKRFRALTAVHDLSFDVGDGEIFGILGPNGAGKTTTVRMLSGLIAPSDGTATINGLGLGPDWDLEEAVRELVGHPSLTPHLDAEQLAGVPDAPGVYLFYGEHVGGGDAGLPLYVGKSTRLRSRVLSHFAADHQSDRELSLSQQVRRVEWIETAGEIGALLKEAELVKRLQPTHNRQLRRHRELCAWRLAPDMLGDAPLELVHAADLDFGRGEALYGFFRTRREAINRLRALARKHALCPPLLGIEKHLPGSRCFDFQLGRCRGACHGGEAPADHALRLAEALQGLRVEHWPWPGAIGLREGPVLHVVEGWRYLGCAADEATLADLLAHGRPAFDLDIYKILLKAVKRLPLVALADAPRADPSPAGSGCHPASVSV